ncbi:VF530 family protein [Verrucomicrobiaceae bacterium 227]
MKAHLGSTTPAIPSQTSHPATIGYPLPVQGKSNDPLHGIKLEEMLTRLEEKYGWDELADRIRIRCFANNPSLKSCLNFLRKTPWARNKVEILFKETFC